MKKLSVGELVPNSWVIIEFDSIATPGYDRYDPTEYANVHYAYYTTNKAVWEQEIIKIERQKSAGTKKSYVAFHVDQVAQAEISIKVVT
jgi:hypothetical protein